MENRAFAESLTKNIKNINRVFASEELARPQFKALEDKISTTILSANVILAVIDNNFSESSFLNKELDLALSSAKGNKNQVILPIILENAPVPKCLYGRMLIPCKSKSVEDIIVTRNVIADILKDNEDNKTINRKRNVMDARSRTFSILTITLAIEVLAIICFLSLTKYQESFLNFPFDKNSLFVVTIAVFAFSTMALFISYMSIMRKSWKEDDICELESYSQRLKESIVIGDAKLSQEDCCETCAKDPEIDALGRMMVNLEDIKEYYTWSQKQAKASFILAASLCVAGFVLIIIAVLLPVVFKQKIQASIIPAICGAVTELVAGTALVVYRNSLSQLNHYHSALHEDERFLSSVNLIKSFTSQELQDSMLQEIIRSEIQMNLNGIKTEIIQNHKNKHN